MAGSGVPVTTAVHTVNEEGRCAYCRITWPCSFERGFQAGLQTACLHLAGKADAMKKGELPEGKPDVMMVVALISDETYKYLNWCAGMVGKLLTERVGKEALDGAMQG